MSSREKPSKPSETIGQRIARLRSDAGLSQSALSKRVGVTQSAISQIEGSERSPSFAMLGQLAQALGISVAYLVGADVESLSPGEERHFRTYRALPSEGRAELSAFVDFLHSKYSRKGS